MILLELSELEAKVLAILLEAAGETFSRRGCNDVDLRRELNLESEEEAERLATELRTGMVKNKYLSPDSLEKTSRFFYDWELFGYFEKLVRKANGEIHE